MNKIKIIVLIGLFLVMIGCRSVSGNLQPLLLREKPLIKFYINPDVSYGDYKTFSVELAESNAILAKQITFYIRNLLETRGYTYVERDKGPDFIVKSCFKNKYETYYTPPSSITIPDYVPAQTITTNLSVYNGVSTTVGTATTYVPGYFTTKTETISGYVVGYYRPSARLDIIDAKDNKAIYSATGVGASDNPDFRVGGQFVIASMLEKLPFRKDPETYLSIQRRIGMFCWIITLDGNSYYPAIFRVEDDSPAKNAGLEKNDIITSINDNPTLNKLFTQFLDMIGKAPELNLKVLRRGNTMDFKIQCNDDIKDSDIKKSAE